MKRGFGAIVLAMLFVALCSAQQDAAAGSTAQDTVLLKNGTQLSATLLDPLDVSTSQSSDDFVLKLSEDIVAGGVTIPKDTELLGRVVRVKAMADGDKESEISLSFDFVKFLEDFLTFKAAVLAVEQPAGAASGDSSSIRPDCEASPVFKGATVISAKGRNLRIESGAVFKLKLSRDVVKQ